MYRILALCLALIASPAAAQQAKVVSSCGAVANPYDTTGSNALTVDSSGKLCVSSDNVVRGAAVYAGGSITTGGTSQQLLALNTNRRGFTIQNQSTGDLYIRVAAAAQLNNTSLRIAPGQLYETPAHHVSTNFVYVIGATTGQTFYATEF